MNPITGKIGIDTKDGQRNVLALGSTLNQTGTAAENLAAALDQFATRAEGDLGELKAASAAMSAALGDDFVQASTEAGTSVDKIVLDLNRMGVSFQDIEANADKLASGLKRIDSVASSIDDVNVRAKGLSGSLDKVSYSGNQSRSVLANMVGNSAQDIGQLNGVTGTLGVGIGQLAEYAADGNIHLSQLAATAGPLAAVTVAMYAISEGAKQAEARTKDFEQAINDLSGATDAAVLQTYSDALLRAALDGKNLKDELAQMADGNLEGTRRLLDLYTAAGATAEQTNGLRDAIAEEERQTAQAAETHRIYGDTLRDTASAASDAAVSISDLGAAAGGAAGATAGLVAALTDFVGINTPFEDATAAVSNLNDVLSNSPDDLQAVALATFNARRAVEGFISQTALIPESKKTEIQALIDRGDWVAVEAALNDVARRRTAVIDVVINSSAALSNASSASKGLTGAALQDLKDRFKPKAAGSSGGGGGGGGGAATDPLAEQDRIAKAMFDQDVWSLDQYRTYLAQRISSLEQFSVDYNRIWGEIHALDEQTAKADADFAKKQQKYIDDQIKANEDLAKQKQKDADDAARARQDELDEQARLQDALYELGRVDDEHRLAYLNQQLGLQVYASAAYLRIYREIKALTDKQLEAEKKITDEKNAQNDVLKDVAGVEGAIAHQTIINQLSDAGAQTRQQMVFANRLQGQAFLAGVGQR